MKRSTLWRSLLLVTMILAPCFVFAQVAPLPDPSDLGTFLAAALNALRGGDWQLVAALGLTGAVFVLRKFGAKWIPWLGTSVGGATFAGLVVLLGGLAAALAAHQPITWTLLGTLLVATWTAAGAWTWGRRILALLAKIPGTIGKLFAWVLALLGGDPDSEVKAAADAAKTATPSTASGISVAAGLDPK
jgi:hypothetical protein